MGTRDIKIGAVLDGMRWMRSCAFALLSTPGGSPERRARLAELTMAVTRARVVAQGYQGSMAPELKLAIGVAEAALQHFGERRGGRVATPGRPDEKGREAEGQQAEKIHPRHAISIRR